MTALSAERGFTSPEPTSESAEVLYLGSGGGSPSVMTQIGAGGNVTPTSVAEFSRGYSIYSLSVSPGGTRLAAGTRAGLLQVYALENHRPCANAKPIFEVFHGSSLGTSVLGLAFLTDDLLASGGEDGCIRVWDVAQHRSVTEIDAHDGGVLALCSLGSLVLASTGLDGVLRIWDLDELKTRYTSEPFPLPPLKALTALDFDAYSGLLMHGSGDGRLYVYDTKDNFASRTVQAHRGGFCALACGPSHLATAGFEDLTLKLWSSSLERPVAEVSLPACPVAVAWSSCDCLAIIGEDGSLHRRRPTGELQRDGDIATEDLRTCAGVPSRVLSNMRTNAERAWRDGRVARARGLLARPDGDACEQIRAIIDELHVHGHCVEAVLLVADLARTQERPLWELQTLMVLVREMGEVDVAAPSIHAIGELLARMKEPELAVEYFERAIAIDTQYGDPSGRIDQLRAHPLWGLSADDCVRGDLGDGRLVLAELEKHTILDKKFIWRSVFKTTSVGRVPRKVELRDVYGESRPSVPANAPFLFVTDNEQRNVTWSYGPSCETVPGLCFALEAVDRGDETAFVAYAIFDPGNVEIEETASAEEHNRYVRDAWNRLQASSQARTWFDMTYRKAKQGIRRAGAQSTSRF